MPILRKYNVVKVRRNAMDGRDYLIALGYSQRSAGTKIVLHIHYDQNVPRFDPHPSPFLRKASARWF
jgi:hypothetical protein